MPLSLEIATHIYLAILTDTGSFHYSSISPRTFDICREALEAGVDPVLVARNVYDSNNMGRLKLFGAVLSAMQIDPTGRIAIVYLDHEMARAAGGTYEDTEGLINLPLTVKEIQAVVFFKQDEGDEYRVSMRSKGDIDIGAVAKEFGGGGHKNAAGCTVTGAIDALQKLFVEKIERDRARAEGRNLNGRPASSSTSRGPTLARRRRARAARRSRERRDRPYRHARSGGERRAAAGARPRDAARAVPERQRQELRGGRPARLLDRHGDAAGRPIGAALRRAAAVARRDRRGARRVSRHVPAAAAGVLGEEDRRQAQLQAGAARAQGGQAGARHGV